MEFQVDLNKDGQWKCLLVAKINGNYHAVGVNGENILEDHEKLLLKMPGLINAACQTTERLLNDPTADPNLG